MNIQILTSSYPAFPDDPSGTAGLFVRAFALELAGRGHRVIIQPVARKEHYEPDPGLIIEPLPWGGGDRELASLNFISPINWPTILEFFRRARKQVLHAHRNHEIDRTLCMWAVPAGLLGYWLNRATGKPYDVWALGSDIWKFGKVPLVGKAILGKVFISADRIFADGVDLCRNVESIAGRHCRFLASSRLLPEPTVSAVRNPERLDLLFVGRYHRNKGPDLLIDSIRELSPGLRRKMHLRMFGVGSMKEALLAAVERSRLDDCISIHDGLGAQQMADELGRSDYLVIPSRIESIPVVFSDALQSGTPVITMPVGDLPDLVKRSGSGILADDLTASGLAAAIILADSQKANNELGSNGYRFWQENFSVSQSVDRWLESETS